MSIIYNSIKDNNITMIANEDMRAFKVGDLIKTVAVGGKLRAALSSVENEIVIGVLAQKPDPNRDTTGQAITVALFSGGGLVKVNINPATVLNPASAYSGSIYASAVKGKAKHAVGFSIEDAFTIGRVADVDATDNSVILIPTLKGRYT